jgi:hypothetical protein
VRSTWRILGAGEQEVAVAREKSQVLALARRLVDFVPNGEWVPIPYNFVIASDGNDLGHFTRKFLSVRDRYVLDLGGDPDAMTQNNVVYAPRFDGSVLPNFTISGAARAFEATVSWRVVAGKQTVARGSTTATLGTSAVFGAYEVPVVVSGVHGKALVEVFQMSAKDGSEIDLVRVPITLP